MQGFAWLARESLADAFRRRIVPVICVLALLSLLVVDNCSGCAPTLTQDGQGVDLPIAAMGAVIMLVALALWTVVLAGVLAADHLSEPLADGSANLLLARPVSRGGYALARLAGAWALAALTGVVLLMAAAVLLQARQGLPIGPAVTALGICLVNAGTVGALAMALSLALGRALTTLTVLAGVALLAGAEVFVFFWQISGADPTPLLERVYRVVVVAPPLASGIVVPLAAWLGPEQQPVLAVALRALLWALASGAILVLSFRRTELGR